MRRALTLISLVVVTLLAGLSSGCSKRIDLEDSAYEHSDRMQAAIREVIEDEARADRLAGLQAAVGEEMRRYYRNYSWAQDDVRRANADYDITADAFERIEDSFTRDRQMTKDTVVRVAMRLRAEMSAEEWARLAKEMR
jgi:hypothetical protein